MMVFILLYQLSQTNLESTSAKENAKKSVECISSSANPADSVEIKLLIDGIKPIYTKLQNSLEPGPLQWYDYYICVHIYN